MEMKGKDASGVLAGKSVVVTGATRGIGRSIAIEAARAGAHVVFAGRNSNDGALVRDEILSAGGKADFVQCDITDTASAIALIDEAVRLCGRIDGLVNNAGVFPYVNFLEATEADLNAALSVNVKGSFFVTQQAVRYMKDSGGGSIVNIGSTHWQTGSALLPTYAVSKGALHTLTRHVAHHFAADHIRCNWISVGWVVTPGEIRRTLDLGHDISWLEAQAANRIPSGRFQTGEDIAHACIFLLSDMSDQITGTDIEVTGGFKPV